MMPEKEPPPVRLAVPPRSVARAGNTVGRPQTNSSRAMQTLARRWRPACRVKVILSDKDQRKLQAEARYRMIVAPIAAPADGLRFPDRWGSQTEVDVSHKITPLLPY